MVKGSTVGGSSGRSWVSVSEPPYPGSCDMALARNTWVTSWAKVLSGSKVRRKVPSGVRSRTNMVKVERSGTREEAEC